MGRLISPLSFFLGETMNSDDMLPLDRLILQVKSEIDQLEIDISLIQHDGLREEARRLWARRILDLQEIAGQSQQEVEK